MSAWALEEGLAFRLARHAALRGDRIAFQFLGRCPHTGSHLTWAELWKAGRHQAARLTAAGLRDRQIGILCADPREFVVSLVATILAGAVAVPMPAVLNRRSAPRFHAIVRSGELAAIIGPAAVLEADWLASAEWPPDVERLSVENLQAPAPAREPVPVTDLSTPLVLQFTSGSTGPPQGVLLSHANIAANCAAITSAYGLTAESVGLSWLPLHHDMGLVGHVLMPMWVGGRSAFMHPLLFLQKPLRWLKAIGDERATITSAPNFAYELCNRAAAVGETLNFDLSSLETAVCGGEPVMPETMAEFIERFAPCGFRRSAFAPSYGLAEATLLVSTGKGPEGPTSIERRAEASDGVSSRITSVGHPVAGTRIRIVDPSTGAIVADGETGEIEVAGDGVGRPLGASPSEWMRTGDLGFLSAGRLYVAGRSKELLILRGQNVFPIEIEAAALKAGPEIVAGAVAAVGVERGGTQAMILIAEMRAGRAQAEPPKDLPRRISEAVGLATGHVPDDVVLVSSGSLPRTTSGKLRRAEIAALYKSGRLAEPWSAVNRVEVPPAHA